MLKGLQSLLYFYLPALFNLGHKVRRLTWEGGLHGAVTGALAREVLEQCLALQLQLLDDWECKAEYTRTISVALLCWQPFMSSLPGCCFVEESCEAMLSRMVGRCRANHQLTSYEDVLRLFVTLPLPRPRTTGTRGGLRQHVVYLFSRRVARILGAPGQQPFARVQSAKEAVWEDSYPDGFRFPDTITTNFPVERLEAVLQAAMVSLTGRGVVSPEVRSFLEENVPRMALSREVLARSDALQRTTTWTAERRRRQRTQGEASSSTDLLEVTDSQPLPCPSVPASPVGPVPPAAPFTSRPVASDGASLYGPPSQAASDGGSLYEPPTDDASLSAGYESYADSDSLGSAGELVEGEEANWSSLEEAGLFGSPEQYLE